MQTQVAQDLFYQMAKEQEVGILLISVKYRNPNYSRWHSNTRGDASTHVLPRTNTPVNSIEKGNGYIRRVYGTAVYSCYY